MNSLEYINREISSTEMDLWYSKRLLIENPANEELKKEILEVKINVLERNMKCLQQIKSELEIMKLIENGWSSIEQTLSGEKIIKFQKLNLDDWLKVWKTLEEIGLKKALEVGNNHE